jgi:hypothetical protein
MHIKYQDKKTGIMTLAHFDRHTMSRTMRRYPAKAYDLVGGDFSPRPIRLAGATERQEIHINGYCYHNWENKPSERRTMALPAIIV